MILRHAPTPRSHSTRHPATQGARLPSRLLTGNLRRPVTSRDVTRERGSMMVFDGKTGTTRGHPGRWST
jgi:hypothetical protein